MKTLKQHFEDMQYPNKFPENEIKAVKKWLQEQPRYYRQAPENKTINAPMLDYRKLIKELEQ